MNRSNPTVMSENPILHENAFKLIETERYDKGVKDYNYRYRKYHGIIQGKVNIHFIIVLLLSEETV